MNSAFTETLNQLRNFNALGVTKTSQATEVSRVYKYSEALKSDRSLASYLQGVGSTGFEKVAMDPLGGEVRATGTILKEMLRGKEPSPGTIARKSINGTNPVKLTGGDPVIGGASLPPTSRKEKGSLSEKQSYASLALRSLLGNRITKLSSTSTPLQVLHHFGLRGPIDAVELFKNSAAYLGMSLPEYLRGAELHTDKSVLLRRYALNKMSESHVDNQVNEAGRVVRAIVKETKTLPEASEVAETANVSPIAANIAIMETAEIIAATGGSVGATGGSTSPAGAIPSPAVVGGGPPQPISPAPPMMPPEATPPPMGPPPPGPPMEPPPMGPPPGPPMGPPPPKQSMNLSGLNSLGEELSNYYKFSEANVASSVNSPSAKLQATPEDKAMLIKNLLKSIKGDGAESDTSMATQRIDRGGIRTVVGKSKVNHGLINNAEEEGGLEGDMSIKKSNSILQGLGWIKESTQITDPNVSDPNTVAYEVYVRDTVEHDGEIPSVEDVMDNTGASRSDAELALARAAR